MEVGLVTDIDGSQNGVHKSLVGDVKENMASHSNEYSTEEVMNKKREITESETIISNRAYEENSENNPKYYFNELSQTEALNENEKLSTEAQKLVEDERLLDAAFLLKKINPISLLTDVEKERIQTANEYISFFSVFKSFNGVSMSQELTSWKSLNVSKINGYLTDCSYNIRNKNDSTSFELDIKISSIVHKSLLIYIIVLLNETDLFYQWFPSWKVPKVKVTRSERLQQIGRCSQVPLFTLQLPWPLNFVELVMDAFAIDDIKSSKSIGIRFNTLKSGDKDGLVPPPEPKVNRLDGNGGFMFDIPSVERKKSAQDGGFIKEDENPDDFLQYTFIGKFENKGFYFPEYLLRFVCRVMITLGWKRFLQVAEEIRDGKRPDHTARIEAKKELYDWVNDRVDVLFGDSP